jgi:Fe-Mn family superoxide dismutase
LFWENLAPKSSGGGEPPRGALGSAIKENWGSLDDFKKTFNASLASIQGSGWSWLVKDIQTGTLQIISLPVRNICNVCGVTLIVFRIKTR